MTEELEFDSTDRRYRATRNGTEVAFTDVDPIGADAVLIKHTEVSPAMEGKGIGGALMRHILESVRAQGKTVIPICPFAKAYIQRHPEYGDMVRR
jgi:predicted GNAT family acetyltransferase